MNDLELLEQENDELRERVRQLEEALSPTQFLPPIEWGLTVSEARLFAHLRSRDLCTKESIMAALYTPGADDEPLIKIVDVFVCKLRKKVKPFGVKIATVWGQGYRLEAAPRLDQYRTTAAADEVAT